MEFSNPDAESRMTTQLKHFFGRSVCFILNYDLEFLSAYFV